MRLWICALGVVAALAVMEAPAAAGSRVDFVSANGASIPPGGVPLVQWNRTLFATGLPPALSSSQQLLPFVGPLFMNVALAPAGNATVLAAEPVLVDAHGGTLSSGVFFGTADSTGRVRFTRVLPAGDARLPLLATSSAGDALLVWGHDDAIAIDRMAPGGRLRPPVVAGHFPVEDVAIDGHGNATLLGYTSGGGRFFVSTAARNGSFGKPTTLPFTSSIAHVSSGTAGQTIV